MRLFCDEITDAIYIMEASCDPLVTFAINNCPEVNGVQPMDQFQVSAKRFKSVSAPNIVTRFRMSKWLKVFIECIFMQYKYVSHFQKSPQTKVSRSVALSQV